MTTGPVWKIKYLKTLKESTKNTGEHSVSLEKANFLKQGRVLPKQPLFTSLAPYPHGPAPQPYRIPRLRPE